MSAFSDVFFLAAKAIRRYNYDQAYQSLQDSRKLQPLYEASKNDLVTARGMAQLSWAGKKTRIELDRLAQTLGVLQVIWNYQGADGENMPDDFAGVEVSVQHPGIAPGVVAQMPAPMQRIPLAGYEMREYEVRLRTFDRAGNRSNWGPPSTITLEQNIDADAIAKQVEDKLRGSDALQQAAREGTLKEMKHLTEAMTQVATTLITSGPIPPDSGTIGSSMWIAPDGRIFVLRAEGDQ